MAQLQKSLFDDGNPDTNAAQVARAKARRKQKPPTGQQRKAEGMSRAAKGKNQLLEDAKQIAKVIAVDGDGTCNADQVAEALRLRGMKPLGRAAGALFAGSDWEFTGRYIESKQPQNHAHPIKVWQYVGKARR